MQHSIYNKINKEAEIILNNYGVSEKADCLAKSNAFISLKDHKPKFSSNSKCFSILTLTKTKFGKLVNVFSNNLIGSELYHW